ncbi:ETX/MTX2 family pore-forming toxin [Bacillus cereus group sp. BfR-BA-01349]|uniref:ETX/MTX2 family pore-forming toxin n=1 Tax=Bacillus cereus group sp. BfR-BA-01349 TaxID=2920312 RepID=UPI001F5988CF
MTNSTTEGYKVGAEVKSTSKAYVKAKFPFGEGGYEHSLEISFTSEYNHSSTTTTKSNEKLWEVSVPVTVPARTLIRVTLVVMDSDINISTEISGR